MNTRWIGRLLLLLAVSACVGAGFALAVWEFFPYAAFRRTSQEERFFMWEAIVWMVGLTLLFFGIAAALGSLHLLNTRMPSMDEVYSHSHIRPPRQDRFSLISVWMILTGVVLVIVAAAARTRLLE